MILNEFLEKVDDKTVLFIGSKISFFFIGTKSRFDELGDRIFVVHKSNIANRLANAKTDKMKKKYKEQLKDMRPFGGREVLEVYEHQTEPGLNVRLEGHEHGSYWFQSEFEKDWGKE